MSKKQIPHDIGLSAIESRDVPTAVRYLLQLIADRAPGGAVELRVPPYGAAQCLGGLDHRRGTPPNVVELSAESFMDLALGASSWDELESQGKLVASGVLASQLRNLFPVAGV